MVPGAEARGFVAPRRAMAEEESVDFGCRGVEVVSWWRRRGLDDERGRGEETYCDQS